LIKKGKGPPELLPLLSPALPKVPRESGGASEGLLILILRHRLGCHPGLIPKQNLGRSLQTPTAWGAAAEVLEHPLPTSRIQPAGEEVPDLSLPEMRHQSLPR
jgi:hypothetical protein